MQLHHLSEHCGVKKNTAMVLKFWNVLLIPLLGVLAYWQNDYTLIIERIEVVKFDKNYFNVFKIHNFKFNRTNFGINLTTTMRQNFGKDLKIQIQAYKFSSNEYRLFPIRFMFDVCDALSKNGFGLENMYRCGNFTRCPMKKGTYVICNWGPDYSRFPPYLPGGRYKTELTMIYKSNEISLLEIYCEIKPKNSWEIKK